MTVPLTISRIKAFQISIGQIFKDFSTAPFCPEVARCVASPVGIFLFGRTFNFQDTVHR